jgi:uncharacterized SAM-binding protein YcdF (DUF218 family)
MLAAKACSSLSTALMYVYLSKILPVFLMPLGLAIFLLALFYLLLWMQRRRLALAAISLALTILWFSSMPVIAKKLYRALEDEYPAKALESAAVAPCAVILGGAIASTLGSSGQIELGEASDRVLAGARLHRMGKIQTILVTAGNQPWSKPGPSEAALVAELLVEWGVPVESIRLEGNSRNTRENAVNSLQILADLPCQNPLLITSAAHMPRALSTFKVLGINAIPVSVDQRTVDGGRLALMDFFPSAGALAMTSEAIREYMGLVVYKLRGWN